MSAESVNCGKGEGEGWVAEWLRDAWKEEAPQTLQGVVWDQHKDHLCRGRLWRTRRFGGGGRAGCRHVKLGTHIRPPSENENESLCVQGWSLQEWSGLRLIWNLLEEQEHLGPWTYWNFLGKCTKWEEKGPLILGAWLWKISDKYVNNTYLWNSRNFIFTFSFPFASAFSLSALPLIREHRYREKPRWHRYY